MNSGLYATYSALLSRTEALDSAASNIANASTAGFKSQKSFFRGLMAESSDPQSQAGNALGAYSVLGGTAIDLSQGSLTKADDPASVALQGEGFLTVGSKDHQMFTRALVLHRRGDGVLVNSDDKIILDRSSNPIKLPSGQISVGTDGAVSVDGDVANYMAINQVKAADIVAEGGAYYSSKAAQVLEPADRVTVQLGYSESANQDVIHGTVELLSVQRQAEMMQKALSVFNGTFDRAATEEIPRL